MIRDMKCIFDKINGFLSDGKRFFFDSLSDNFHLLATHSRFFSSISPGEYSRFSFFGITFHPRAYRADSNTEVFRNTFMSPTFVFQKNNVNSLNDSRVFRFLFFRDQLRSLLFCQRDFSMGSILSFLYGCLLWHGETLWIMRGG